MDPVIENILDCVLTFQEPEVSSESEMESGSGGSESSDDDEEEDDDQDGDAESNDGNQDSDFSQDQTSPGKRKSTTDSGEYIFVLYCMTVQNNWNAKHDKWGAGRCNS